MSSFSGLLVFALMIACLSGCTRQYVAKPSAARDYNALDWTIESAPQVLSREQEGSAVDETEPAGLGSTATEEAIDETDRSGSDPGAAPIEEAIDEPEEDR